MTWRDRTARTLRCIAGLAVASATACAPAMPGDAGHDPGPIDAADAAAADVRRGIEIDAAPQSPGSTRDAGATDARVANDPGDTGPCADACTFGATRCSGADQQTCGRSANGCTDWAAPSPCNAPLTCSGGECVDPSADAGGDEGVDGGSEAGEAGVDAGAEAGDAGVDAGGGKACVIAGKTYAKGTARPNPKTSAQSCEHCNPSVSATSWSPVPASYLPNGSACLEGALADCDDFCPGSDLDCDLSTVDCSGSAPACVHDYQPGAACSSAAQDGTCDGAGSCVVGDAGTCAPLGSACASQIDCCLGDCVGGVCQ